MTDLEALALRISPTREGWAWRCPANAACLSLCYDCAVCKPAPLDQPACTLRLREWASTRPWWDLPHDAGSMTWGNLINVALQNDTDAAHCAHAVYSLIAVAERRHGKGEKA